LSLKLRIGIGSALGIERFTEYRNRYREAENVIGTTLNLTLKGNFGSLTPKGVQMETSELSEGMN
jgi:hypothetical protein